MDSESSPSCPQTVTVRRNPHRRARPTPSTNPPKNPIPLQIPSFPLNDILSIDLDQPDPPPPSASPVETLVPENLKVFLRIRPLVPLKAPSKFVGAKAVRKNVWPKTAAPKNGAGGENKQKKKSSEVCVSVNDSHSVTLSPPLALQEFKRIKAEVFHGFSHVFAADSSQNEVYEKMVRPLVEDFLRGKNGMIAALGPSGSGKTHTVFGTPRQPGMVPLVLQDIFKRNHESDSNLSRSFYISIFEILSERGKVERVSDLSPDGADLSIQQSTIRGLKEIAISDAAQAELLIARAILKRATAMTNTNNQSSRSQCIINIHSHVTKFHEELDCQPMNSVLTIVDLAGAEREKRTGNQGSRLLESNFINNTSMVFGLCLRSLLEHQKNPKKPLQKHFLNSLLTRYLRDYLEGKKRMTLILTVKPGEEDYLDSVYLLRQASPYMKIKFSSAEEPSISESNKRHIQTLSRIEKPKRMKYSGRDANVIEEVKVAPDEQPLEEHCIEDDSLRMCKLESGDAAPVMSDGIIYSKVVERNHQIMQNFAKALWNVLKQHKEKLTMAENEIRSLNEHLRNEKTRYAELEKELVKVKSCCTCSKEILSEADLVNTNIKFEGLAELERNESSNIQEIPAIKLSEFDNPVINESIKAYECSCTPEKCASSMGRVEELSSQDASARSPDHRASKCNDTPVQDQDVLTREPLDVAPLLAEDVAFTQNCNPVEPEYRASKCNDTPVQDQDVVTREPLDAAPLLAEDVAFTQNCNPVEPEYRASKCNDTPAQDQDVLTREPLDTAALLEEDVAFTKNCSPDEPDNKSRSDTSCKLLNLQKPKRRLLPASSVLLRDIGALGIEDETEKPKGNRDGRNMVADERKRTQGSISLMRLLQSNLHL